MVQPAETGIVQPPPETEPTPPPAAKVQYLRACTLDGRTFEHRKRWPTLHEKVKADLGVRIDLITWRGGAEPHWEFIGKPLPGTAFDKAGRVITCEVQIALACVEGLIAPSEHERVVAQRKADQERLLQENGILVLPGHTQRFRELVSSEKRVFAIGRAWPALWADPKRELFFKGTVKSITQLLHDERGLYYEIIGDPAPGTPAHEKGRLLICELSRTLVESVEATWVPADLDAVTALKMASEELGAEGSEGEDYDAGVNPVEIID